MRTGIVISLAFVLAFLGPRSVVSGLVTGASARAQFEQFRDEDCDSFIDFEDFPTGLLTAYSLDLISPTFFTKYPANLLEQVEWKVNFRTTEFRWPLPEVGAPENTPVAVLPTGFITSPPNHRLMGVRDGNIPDGQARYEISFNPPVHRVGLLRMWEPGSITRFYAGPEGHLLVAEHILTSDQEFVGYISNSPSIDDWIRRIEFDGIPHDPESAYNKLYPVGEIDDLFFSWPAVTQFDICFEPSSIRLDQETTMSLEIVNLRNYAQHDIGIKLHFYSHEDGRDVDISLTRDIPPHDSITLKYKIQATNFVKYGHNFVTAEIYAPSGELISRQQTSYYVRKGTIDAVHILLNLMGD